MAMIPHRPEQVRSCVVDVDFSFLPLRRMSPEEIKALRQELGCTPRELATALGLDQETVLAWERAELFPTKRLVKKMGELRERGPAAVPRRVKGQNPAPLHQLAN